jgi:hypothetical protein
MASTNITTFPGKVGVSNANPTHTLSIGSNVFVDDTGTNKLVVLGSISTTGTLSGDGSGISNIQSSNVIGLTSNVERIDNLVLNLSDNSSRITTVANDLSDNSSRITTVANDLSDNSSRITVLESGDTNITGKKTFTEQVTFESNIHVKGDLLVANTINMVVSDPIIELGSNNLNTGDIGFVMTRHGASESNVAVFYDESADVLKMGYTLSGANNTTIELDSNALAVSIQGNLEVGTANLFVDTTTSNVGVGTTNPGALLELSKATGSATISPTELRLSTRTNAADWSVTDPWARLSFYTDDVTGDAPGVMASVGAVASSVNGGENTRLAFFTAEPHLERMCVDRYGNVGIGTANPSAKLDIKATTSYIGTSSFADLKSNAVINFTGYADAGDVCSFGFLGQTVNGNNPKAYIQNANSIFGEPVAEDLLLQPNGGNVGIGTLSPAFKLDVHGTANVGVLSATLPLATVASNLVTYDTATGQLLDSNGLVSNKLSIVSEQPPSALTGATTTVNGHGKYVVTTSIQASGYEGYKAFDKNVDNGWSTGAVGAYNSDGTYAGSNSLASVSGEWVKIKFPYKTTLRHISLVPLSWTTAMPENFSIVASNDDSTWVVLKAVTGQAWSSTTQYVNYIVDASTAYKYYAIVVELTNTNFAQIGEWKLFTETFSVDAGKVNMTGASGLETGFTEHPVAPMTGYHTYVEGHGTYEASESNVFSGTTAYGWKIFDYETSTDWATNGGYDSSTGAFTSDVTTTDVGGTRYNGHWVQIKTPYPITLSHSNVYPTNVNRSPVDSVILGSNDGENWYKLNEFTGQTYSASTWKRLDVNATTPYQYYRMCVTKKATGDTVLGIREWRLFAEKDVTKFENVHISGDLSSETLQTGYIKWPRKSLKANESEGYVASASSAVNFDVFTLYNERLVGFNTEYWSTNVTYTNGVHDNTVSTTDINGVVHYGEWAQIQLPTEVALSFLKVYPRRYGTDVWPLQRVPSAGSILGSNDGTTWKNIQRFSGVTYTLESTVSGEKIDVHASETYKYYRLVCTTLLGVTSAADRVDMMELQLFEAATGVGGAPTSAKLQVHGSLGLAKGSSLYTGDSVVAEFPKHDRPLTKYPEVAMTAASTAGYVANASSFYNFSSYPAHEIFNGVYGTELDMWVSSLYTYNVADGTVDTSNVATFQGISGEYVTLNLPKKISLKKVRLHSRNNSGASNPPNKGRIFGSNGDSIWKQLTTYDDLNMSHNDYRTIQVNATEYYKNYTFLIEEITIFGTATYACIAELELYGHEEGDESVDVVHRSVPNKPGQQQLAVYWDANDSNSYSFADSSNVYDLSGSGVTGTLNGVGYDAVDNAWVFDGSGDYIDATLSNPSGDWVHSTSFWYRQDSVVTATWDYLYHIGTVTFGSSAVFALKSDGYLAFTNYGLASVRQRFTPSLGKWYHFTIVYSGGGVTTDNVSIYIDGKILLSTFNDGNGSSVSLSANTNIRLGADNSGSAGSATHGSIANFRLFSKTLNADQVRELYEYDAPRFGHRTNVVALHKGNLGVGVTAPTSRFEVAGREDLQEYPPKAMTGYETYMEGHGVFKGRWANWYSGNTPWGMYTKTPNGGGQGNIWYGPYQANNGYSGGNVYSGTDFAASTTSGLFLDDVNGTRYYGAWTTLEMPHDILLKRIHLYQAGTTENVNTRCIPEDGVILGSDNGNDWYHIHTFTGLTYGGSIGSASYSAAGESVAINADKPYKHYALVVTRTLHYSFTVIIGELYWFGTPAPSGLEDGHLTLGKALTAPRFTGHAAGAETPRAESLVVHYDTTVDSVASGTTVVDISGQGNNQFIQNGLAYSSSSRALDFAATNARAYNANGPNSAGSWVHSVSLWFKVYQSQGTFFFIGEKTVSKAVGLGLQGNNRVRYFFWGNDTDSPTNAISLNTWTHVVATYDGGTTKSLYINGEKVTTTDAQTQAALSLATANDDFLLGAQLNGTDPFKGLMSNFKLYDVALTAEEVAAEYALGRTGKSLNVTDTAVCLGGTVPRAQLDVRGSAFASKYFGGVTTFLTGDYTSTAITSFTSIGQTIAMIEYTFDVPQEYHLLGRANLESQVMIKWCGEMDDPWNFMFYIDLYHSGLSTPVKSAFNTDSSGTRSNGAGVPVINHHEDYSSTLESAMIGSRIYIPNCDVSSGSTITVKLVGRRGSYNTSGNVYTNRTSNNTDNINYERGITNFFMALKVV